eukprot:PhF_6_TR37592/c0_g1_i3/m.55798
MQQPFYVNPNNIWAVSDLGYDTALATTINRCTRLVNESGYSYVDGVRRGITFDPVSQKYRIRSEGDGDVIHPATPLHFAASHGHLECVKLLVTHGADPNIQGSNDIVGVSPLQVAKTNGHSSVVVYLEGVIAATSSSSTTSSGGGPAGSTHGIVGLEVTSRNVLEQHEQHARDVLQQRFANSFLMVEILFADGPLRVIRSLCVLCTTTFEMFMHRVDRLFGQPVQLSILVDGPLLPPKKNRPCPTEVNTRHHHVLLGPHNFRNWLNDREHPQCRARPILGQAGSVPNGVRAITPKKAALLRVHDMVSRCKTPNVTTDRIYQMNRYVRDLEQQLRVNSNSLATTSSSPQLNTSTLNLLTTSLEEEIIENAVNRQYSPYVRKVREQNRELTLMYEDVVAKRTRYYKAPPPLSVVQDEIMTRLSEDSVTHKQETLNALTQALEDRLVLPPEPIKITNDDLRDSIERMTTQALDQAARHRHDIALAAIGGKPPTSKLLLKNDLPRYIEVMYTSPLEKKKKNLEKLTEQVAKESPPARKDLKK